MEKNKKVIIISIITILVIAIIAGLIYFFVFNKDNNSEGEISKINKLYTTLQENNAFTFSIVSDDNNKMYYAKQDDKAYIDTVIDDKESKFLIRDGNSYLLVDDEQKYYTYQNNETDLDKVRVEIEELKDKQYTQGKEKIENKTYKYEEYDGVTDFLIKIIDDEGNNAKTRFYFSGDKLVYIKTILEDYQQVLKVDISYDAQDNLFEIPSEYNEA